MPTLLQRLSTALAEVATIEESDDALTVMQPGVVASLRVVTIAEGLEMVSLTQPLAWDLPLNAKVREKVAQQASKTLLGTVALVEKTEKGPVVAANGSTATSSTRKSTVKRSADVLLRYNFPGAGLSDEALRTLILMVLAAGADVREALS
jgi:hypothetical protein